MIKRVPETKARFRVTIDLIGGQSRQFVRYVEFDHQELPDSWTRRIRDGEVMRIDDHRRQAKDGYRGSWIGFIDEQTHAVGAYRADEIVGVTVEIVSVPPPKE